MSTIAWRERRPRLGTIAPGDSIVALAGAFLFVVVLCATIGPLIATIDPSAQDLSQSLVGPNGQHWLGTDSLGRDIFWRTVDGARSAVVGPLLIALGAMAIGNVLGLLAGYRAGAGDTVIMRWADFMYALPALLVAIIVVGVIGGGYYRAILLLIVLYSPYDTRIVRGATLEQRSRPYVEAARTLGLKARRIIPGTSGRTCSRSHSPTPS